MKLVRESLNEFHQTGDPLGSLNVGIDAITIDVIFITISLGSNPDNKYVVTFEDKFQRDLFQDELNKKRYLNLRIQFKDPESNREIFKEFKDFKISYGDKYKFIKYNGHYFEF